MMYTEEEARGLLCHRTIGQAEMLTCTALGCMAWRWGEELRRRCKVYGGGEDDMPEPQRPKDVPPSWEWEPNDGDCMSSWVEPEAEAQERRRGFCGLAGKVEP